MVSIRDWWAQFQEVHQRITTTQQMIETLRDQAIQIATGRTSVGKISFRVLTSSVIGCLHGAQALLERLGEQIGRPPGPRPRKG